MAEVAKSVVREESGGGEEEEDGPSLGEMIEAELRGLGGGWVGSDSGWSTVEEVAKGILVPGQPQAGSQCPLAPDSPLAPPGTGSPIAPPGTGSPLSPQGTGSPLAPQGTGSPLAPPETSSPVSPQGNGSPVSPQGTGSPVSPQVAGSPVSPQGAGSPVSPQGTGCPVSPQGTGCPVSHQGTGSPVSPQGTGRPVSPQGTSSPVSPQVTGSPLSPQITGSPLAPLGTESPQAPESPLSSPPLPQEHVNGEPNSVETLTPASPLSPKPPAVLNGHPEMFSCQVEDCADTVHEEVVSCVELVLEEVIEQTVRMQVEESEVMESVAAVTEKKKKKKSLGGEEGGEESVTTIKKKTKKTKKTEGKENHISVIENGHEEEEECLSPSSPSSLAVEDDDLSNVCVKDLKLNYVNEASKSFNGETKASTEVPVLPPVPIRELRRSFGDIHKACENAEIVQSDNVTCEKQLKSSFSKFDQLSKKTVLHVRSSDPAKAQKTFSQGTTDGQVTVLCKACEKAVFAMEQIKAERAVWHKNCFRCHTCKKQLTVDIYQSHEGELYCKPHFRELFKPKVVLDEEEPASDKPDLGLEELGQLNVKSRFQVFEKQDQADGELERSPTTVSVKRSSSILSKLAKFQKKGMDVGVTDESLNGFVYEESSSSEEDEDEEEEEEKGVIKCRRKARERPVSFSKMDDVKRNWESVQQSQRREEMREERKQELQQIRSRLFQGKQGKMKELYEQAVAESEKSGGKKEGGEEIIMGSEKAKTVRERFEKGDAGVGEGGDGSKKPVEEDMAVFEEGISKKSRSIFLEMEAAAKSNPVVTPGQQSPVRSESIRRPREAYYKREVSQCEDIVRSSDVIEDVAVQTADLSSRFKFFETYKAPEKQKKAFRITPPREGQVKTESPEREVYRDPDVVRCDDKLEDESAIKKSQTASRMLSMFRQLEEQKEVLPDGPKPKKCFTPPPDYKGSESSEEESGDEEEESEEEEEESETEEGVIKSSYKVKDEFLEQARHAARAKELAAKFESWEPEKQSTNNAINMLDSENASIESTKSLKARFESLQNELPKEKNRPKVNRFVELPAATLCASCERKVYPLEKIETNGKIFHKGCFRCSYCNCILRMDTYTLNNGHLYCLPHFKQLFISKGNYDEGFGTDQHKRKWEQPVNGNTSS